MPQIVSVNPTDSDWTTDRFILGFGHTGYNFTTHLMVWGNSLEDAMDEAVDWLVDNAPGCLADTEVSEEYERLVADGMSEEDAQEEAEADTAMYGNYGNYISCQSWGVVAENPTRARILAIRAEHY